MAEEREIGKGGSGKVRSFWTGFLLTAITLGIYQFFWYYFVNDELRDIGDAQQDQNLAGSSPALSVAAILFGGIIVVPPLLSIYNYGKRIQRAQRLAGVGQEEQINPTLAFLLYFPGLLLVVPYFLHFWYLTKHQNRAVLAV
jgi:hypothetical protein